MTKVELINLVAFSFFIIASWLRPLANRRRMAIAATGVTGLALILSLHLADRLLSPFTVAFIRDWLPVLLMPMVYWQAGWFTNHLNGRFQDYLQRLDQTLLGSLLPGLMSNHGFRLVAVILELAYLSCYVLVPLGLAVLYIAKLESHAAEYWAVILLATYPCYVFTAFAPTIPPRLLETHLHELDTRGVRRFNLAVVRLVSTEINTFPSAHVTATLGGSLVLFHVLPAAGLLFLLVSIGIALGAVLGRYHYAADVLLAVALTLVVFALEIVF